MPRAGPAKSDTRLTSLTKAITSGKPFTRAELAARFSVSPDKVSDVVARLKQDGWQVQMPRREFQGPITYVVTATTKAATTRATTKAAKATTASKRARQTRRRRPAPAAPASSGAGRPAVPGLGELFEVVLLVRSSDGSTTVGLRSAASGEVQLTWPSNATAAST
jgi:hypothetical protein